MKREIVSQFPMVELTVVALLIFVTFFVLTWLRTYSTKQKQIFPRLAQLPLEEGTRHDELQ